MKAVGLIGFGTMGSKAAEKILQAGHSLKVYDVSIAACEKARAMGAAVMASPGEAAEQSELVLMFLPSPREVEMCVTGPNGILSKARPGTALVDLSTVDPASTQRMAEAARAKKVGYLDAPVLGRPASVGNWGLPVGGDPAVLEMCRPVLGALAARITHIGSSGTGNVVKLLNNLLFGAINAMTAEIMALAAKMGISPGIIYETISASGAATVSNLFKELGRRISAEDYSDPTFTVDLLAKDVRLACQMAKESKAALILARTVEVLNDIAQVRGLGGYDTSIMWKSYEKIWEGND
jgi:3-hydroxyisobutyrate dehydrogenase-like beta-hydroxyacid dehydrogenase